jgi:hypothetical protein
MLMLRPATAGLTADADAAPGSPLMLMLRPATAGLTADADAAPGDRRAHR